MTGGEFDLIRRHFSGLDRGKGVLLGIGDDAALLRLPSDADLVTSVDTLTEAIHFPAGTLPEHVGFRAVATAASDLAAMGADPLGMLLALSLPEADELWLRSFVEGVGAAAHAFRLPLAGGDLTRGPLVISVTVMGSVPRDGALTRSGAGPGDRLCVSGCLGDGAAGLALVQGQLNLDAVSLEDAEYLEYRFLRPEPQFALGSALRGVATAALDVSDGLLADAEQLARRSAVGIVIDADAVPLSSALLRSVAVEQARHWALTGGDDYELLFTLPAGAAIPAGCTDIGVVTMGNDVRCDGFAQASGGYDHFA